MELITAQSSKKYAKAFRDMLDEFEKIVVMIDTATRNGEFSITLQNISHYSLNELREKQYVIINNGHEGYIISWELTQEDIDNVLDVEPNIN